MQGCAPKATPTTPDVNTKNLSNEKSQTNPKLSNLVGKNYVKGIITSLNQDTHAGAWNYVIEGVDTTNGKLPYDTFNHKTVVANDGE